MWIRSHQGAGPPTSTSEKTVESCQETVLSTPSSPPTKNPSNGDLETFDSGAKREPKLHKSRPDLICPFTLDALGYHLGLGAIKHGARNWEQGLPDDSYLQSLARHYVDLIQGKLDEDHASAMLFNLMGLRRNAETGRAGGTSVKIFTLEMWKEKMHVSN